MSRCSPATFRGQVGDSTRADGHHFLTLFTWLRHLTPLSLFPHVHDEDNTIYLENDLGMTGDYAVPGTG